MNHYAIGLDLNVEKQAPGILHDFQEILAHEDLAATENEEKHAGFGELIEHVLDLGRGHLAFVVVIEIAMNAAFVAAVGDVEVNAEGNAQLHRLIVHLDQQAH